MNYKLMDEITKILILCRYEDKHGRGDTAQEIQNFEKRAIDAYQGKSDDPHKVILNIFHAKINLTAALIFDAIERHPNQAMNSDGEKQCNCVSGRAQSTGGCPIHGCTF